VRNAISRIIGVIFIFTAIIGILFSITALVWMWMLHPTITENMQGNVRLINNALTSTAEGLDIADHSLETSISSLTTLELTVEATARSIQDTTPMVDTLVILSGEDLPATVTSAQLSLTAAQDSAEIIDSVLRFVSNLPLVPRTLYNPPVPLHIALAQVSESLENIPQALNTMETSLEATSANLVAIETDITLIAADLSEINLSMVEARGVVNDYQILISDLQFRVEQVETDLPGWLNSVALILSFLLVWAGVSQFGLFMQGIDLIRGRRL
jgi:hypothetical protein